MLLLQMISKQQKLEGDFRFHHSRLLMHAEEIAFYRGWDIERHSVNESFDNLYKHVNNLLLKQAIVGSTSFIKRITSSFRFWWRIWNQIWLVLFLSLSVVFDSWLVKYGATMVGYAGTVYYTQQNEKDYWNKWQ